MTSRSPSAVVAATVATLLAASTGHAADNPETKAILDEIRAMKRSYEARIEALEKKIQNIQKSAAAAKNAKPAASEAGTPVVRDNSFNPSISAVLNGTYSNYSSSTSEIAGFAVGEEGETGPRAWVNPDDQPFWRRLKLTRKQPCRDRRGHGIHVHSHTTTVQ